MVLVFKELAGTVSHVFEARIRGGILLELEMMNFPPIIFKLFFRVAGFAHPLRMFSYFYPHLKIWE